MLEMQARLAEASAAGSQCSLVQSDKLTAWLHERKFTFSSAKSLLVTMLLLSCNIHKDQVRCKDIKRHWSLILHRNNLISGLFQY